jgi:hypothetical protein
MISTIGQGWRFVYSSIAALSARRPADGGRRITIFYKTDADTMTMDKRRRIADMLMLAVFAAVSAGLIAMDGDKGAVFTVFVAVAIMFLAAAVSLIYSRVPRSGSPEGR